VKNTYCFLNAARLCEPSCIAYDDGGRASTCKLINMGERLIKALIPVSSRPVDPAPKVK
jgi:hypothetical protein